LKKNYFRVFDDSAVLNVEPLDFFEVAVVGSVGGDELRHDGHLLSRVHSEIGSLWYTNTIVNSSNSRSFKSYFMQHRAVNKFKL